MCARLPLAARVRAAGKREGVGGGDGVVFEGEGDNGERMALRMGAEVLREVLRIDEIGADGAVEGSEMRVFLAHGDLDPKVPVELGQEARDCVQELGCAVEWYEQKGLGHWYSPEMLKRLVAFLEQAGFEVADGSHV